MTQLDDQAAKVLTGVLDTLSDEDKKTIVPFLAAGPDVTWDQSCGMAYVKFVNAQPSFNAVQSRNCPWLDVVWEATIVRCLDYTDEGEIEPAEMMRASAQALTDMDGLLCHLAPLGTIMTSTMVGPLGTLLAAQVQVSMLMSACA